MKGIIITLILAITFIFILMVSIVTIWLKEFHWIQERVNVAEEMQVRIRLLEAERKVWDRFVLSDWVEFFEYCNWITDELPSFLSR